MKIFRATVPKFRNTSPCMKKQKTKNKVEILNTPTYILIQKKASRTYLKRVQQ